MSETFDRKNVLDGNRTRVLALKKQCPTTRRREHFSGDIAKISKPEILNLYFSVVSNFFIIFCNVIILIKKKKNTKNPRLLSINTHKVLPQ